MLQTISKHIQGWIAGVVIFIIAAAFLLFGLEYYVSRGGDSQTVVAKVNGVKISLGQLNHTLDLLQRNYTQQGVVLDEQARQQLRGIALEQLILDRVMLQTAQKMHLTIDPEQIRQEIMRIPTFQEKGQFSQEKFQQILSDNHLNPSSFIHNLQASLILEQLSGGLQKSSFVTPFEVSQIYGLLQQERSFGYFTLPISQFLASANPTTEQINDYYQKHKDQFRLPEQIKFSYILLSPDSIRSEVKVNPQDVEAFYKEHAAEYTGKSLAEVKDIIEKRLYQQKLDQLLATKSEQLGDLTYTNPDSLDPAAQALNLPIQTSPWMSRQGIQGDSLFSDSEVLNILFSDEVLKNSDNSQVIELKNGSALVVRFADRQESKVAALETVKDQIKRRLQREQAQNQAGLQAYEIQHALETGKDIGSLSKQYNLTWTVKKNITRQDKNLSAQLLSTVFEMVPSADSDKKAVTSVLLESGDYAIIQLETFRNADFSQASSEERTKLRNQLAARWEELEFQFFAQSAIDRAKIEKQAISH